MEIDKQTVNMSNDVTYAEFIDIDDHSQTIICPTYLRDSVACSDDESFEKTINYFLEENPNINKVFAAELYSDKRYGVIVTSFPIVLKTLISPSNTFNPKMI